MEKAKTLVIVAHPDIDNSIINKRWMEELQTARDLVTVNALYSRYPDHAIDVAFEQDLLVRHDSLILQFPLYWFGTPPLLKQWLDEVLLPGFAYGSKETDRKLAGKGIGLAISAGIREVDYTATGRYAFTLEELIRPLRLTIEYVSAKPLPVFAFYGAEEGRLPTDIDASAREYVEYIKGCQELSVPDGPRSVRRA